jgi:hypothetical protein
MIKSRRIVYRNAYRVLVGKLAITIPVARPRHKWEDSMKMDLREIAWSVWTGFIRLRVGTCVVGR